ncbi:hypothetical protein LPJ57_004858 [Coemansia sp. RSA 486]|nr:hypothetical protein LPJ57_004858 [Coemansia sp. RSA 486]KAJ2226162.1 hypothetical protein IWW45_007576 [Coemansia sp. RSA 485]KAJ2597024.1 hypothetical protein GGF39_003222 [Coemansia sp. RSA 1721]
MAASKYSVFFGCLVDTPSLNELRIRTNGALGVDQTTGRIIGVSDDVSICLSGTAEALVESWTGQAATKDDIHVTTLSSDQFLMPGLIDTHTHAPQFAFLGIGHDLPLMDWLEKYTFKHESEFKDPKVAKEFYHDVINRVIRNGVTFAAYYGTIHTESNRVLADTIRNAGQRAFVGKVCMDVNSPSYYSESTEESIEGTEKFVKAILGDQNESTGGSELRLVRPIVTPRFAPTCSMDCLRGLGDIAHKYQLPVQSHLCENPSEVAFVKQCFPDSTSYTDVYRKAGLLGHRTIMAHCVHMSADDIKHLRETGSCVSHCPTSNFALGSGIADVRRFIANDIPVGLGTDVGGGYTPSILDAMRMAAAANRALIAAKRDRGEQLEGRDAVPLEAGETVFLATQGGARVMGMADQLGSLDKDKLFDAIVVDLDVPSSPVPSVNGTPAVKCLGDPAEAWRVRLEQFVFLADDRNIARVYVGGNLIHTKQ